MIYETLKFLIPFLGIPLKIWSIFGKMQNENPKWQPFCDFFSECFLNFRIIYVISNKCTKFHIYTMKNKNVIRI